MDQDATDVIGVDATTGSVRLAMVEDRPWDDPVAQVTTSSKRLISTCVSYWEGNSRKTQRIPGGKLRSHCILCSYLQQPCV